MRKPLIGVMGPGDNASPVAIVLGLQLGKLIAQKEWILLSGGRNVGVMEAVSKGAKSKNGLTIGLLPISDNSKTSQYIDVAILTGMGSARNNIEILSADALIIIAESMGPGTTSEAALALKVKKKIILLSPNKETEMFFKRIGGNLVYITQSPEETIKQVEQFLP